MSRAMWLVMAAAVLVPAAATLAADAVSSPAATPAELAAEAGTRTAWIAWSVPPVPGRGRSCCQRSTIRACRLDGGDGWMTTDDPLDPRERELRVYVKLVGGEPVRVRAFTADCAVDPGSLPLLDAGPLAVGDSVDWLSGIVAAGRGDVRDDAVAAVAGHAGPAALAALVEWSAASDADLRETAAFWLGASRGEEALSRLVAMIEGDPSSQVREHAVFALSLVDTPAATDALVRTARRHPDGDVRGTALFWLGQKAGERVEETLRNAVDDDPMAEVREQAVFALSQLPPERGVPLLVDLAREHRDPGVRRQALFWLGQSGDPRALELFESLLE